MVVKAWAERPESSDEEEESETEHANKGSGDSKKRPRSGFLKGASVIKRNSLKLPKNGGTKRFVDGSHSDTETKVEDLRPAKWSAINKLKAPSFDKLSRSDTDKSNNENEEQKSAQDASSGGETAGKPIVDRRRVMNLILRGTAKAVGRLQHRIKRPKFNFEKYISYLQNVIPTVGFCIAGVIISWNMVSTLLFLEFSLLALFVQESIFGSQTATVKL